MREEGGRGRKRKKETDGVKEKERKEKNGWWKEIEGKSRGEGKKI